MDAFERQMQKFELSEIVPLYKGEPQIFVPERINRILRGEMPPKKPTLLQRIKKFLKGVRT